MESQNVNGLEMSQFYNYASFMKQLIINLSWFLVPIKQTKVKNVLFLQNTFRQYGSCDESLIIWLERRCLRARPRRLDSW